MAGLLRQSIRSFSVCRTVFSKGDAQDPIQRLFVDKLREYGVKAKQTGGLFEAPAEITKGLHDELEAIERRRNPNKADMTKFPTFQFSDAAVEAPGIGVQVPIAPELKDTPSNDVRVIHADPWS